MAKPSRPSNLLRMWFPFALVALLLLGIPGAVLFALNLFGQEGEVNNWLEANFRLSYHLPIPWWGALLLFLVPPLLILLYFLKLKRKSVQVPSTFLWKKSIEDLHVNSLFQWLRNNILLILQLLVLLALIYGILAPRFHGAGGHGKHYILMIDNSASMSATDIAPSRLEWAKAEALKEIDAAGDNDVGMLIVFNSRAEIRQSYTSDRATLRQRVREIEATQRPTQIDEALNLADSLANPRTSTENEAVKPGGVETGQERTYAAPEGLKAEVHLYSDGRFPDAPDFALGNLDLHYHVAGQSAANVGIVVFNAVRDENDKNQIQVFARLQNFGPDDVTTKFELEVRVGGQLKKRFEKSITIPKFGKRQGDGDETTSLEKPGERSLTFDVSDIDDQTEFVLHARLAELKDIFQADNEAWLVVGVARKARVLVVSDGNRFLRAFFDDEATQALAETTWLTRDDFAKPSERARKYLDPARSGAFDLVIFDRCGPETEDEMPRGNTFFIGHVPPPFKVDPGKKADKVFVKGWVAQSPLLRYLTSLHEVGVAFAHQFTELPPKAPRLLEAEDNQALMISLTRGAHTDVVQLFPLIDDNGAVNTNWPLQPSFPIFWTNVLYALGNVSDAASEDVLRPGTPKRLRPPGAVERLQVADPDGRTQTLERIGSRSDFDYQGTNRIGVYQAEWPNGGRGFAVNLLDSDESNLQPREAIQIGNETVAAGVNRTQSRELWKWAVLLGFVFLLVEWVVYNKRIYV